VIGTESQESILRDELSYYDDNAVKRDSWIKVDGRSYCYVLAGMIIAIAFLPCVFYGAVERRRASFSLVLEHV
jgi:hypothetical protein